MTTTFAPPEGMTVQYFDRLAGVKPGPWTGEPDKGQWIDPATDLDCLIVRGRTGALCGYVGIPFEHKLHGADCCDIPVTVHGDTPNYSALCQEENPDGICHSVTPGRPENVWWVGFHCGRFMDVEPRTEMEFAMMSDNPLYAELLAAVPYFNHGQSYKTFDYVKAECESLARQLAALA